MEAIVGNSAVEQQMLESIHESIKSNTLLLPSLPEIAMQVRQEVNKPDCTAGKLSKLISKDPAMSARVLKVVNSVALRGNKPINDLQSAIARMGMQQAQILVTSLSIIQLFNTGSTALAKYVKKTVEHSMEIGTTCYAIAKKYGGLSPQEAMLAGLIHDIGVLPIITYLNNNRNNDHKELLQDEQQLTQLIAALHTQVGAWILETWRFSPELVAVPLEHENIMRNCNSQPDYVDVVIAANLEYYTGTDHPTADIKWADVPATKKLKIDKNGQSADDEKMIEEMDKARELLIV